jgi:hypothetical protein
MRESTVCENSRKQQHQSEISPAQAKFMSILGDNAVAAVALASWYVIEYS